MNIQRKLNGLALAMTCSISWAQQALTEAEVRKIDLSTQKITLKHGEIKNLDMPPMTMVFSVKDPAMLDKLKAGDKILFSADKLHGNYTVTTLKAAWAAP